MSNGQSDFLLWELQCWFLQVHTRRNTERAFPMSFDSYMLRRIQVWLIDSIFSPLSPLQHELELKHTQKDALNGCRINNGRNESFLNTNFQLFLVRKYDSIPCPFEIFNRRNMLRLLGNVVRILMFSFLKIPKQQNEKNNESHHSLLAVCVLYSSPEGSCWSFSSSTEETSHHFSLPTTTPSSSTWRKKSIQQDNNANDPQIFITLILIQPINFSTANKQKETKSGMNSSMSHKRVSYTS